LVGIIFYLLYTNLKASFVSIFLLGFFYAIFYLFTKEILNIQGIKSESSNKGRFRTAIEIFESIRDIKIYSAENFFEKRFKIFSKEFANTNSTYSSLVASPKYLLEMIVFVALAITILLLTLNNSISINSIPLLGTFAFAAYKAQPALSNVIYGINSLEYGSKIISNLFKKINLKKTDYYSKTKISFKSLSKKNSYCLLIKNLCYKYNNKEIMKDLNLEIDFPSLFIVAGESGSGKSTLLNLIAGLLKPQKGEIIFNKDLFNKRKPKISYLHQNHTLYDTSITENIAFGIKREEIDYKLINLILKEVRILDFVNSLKDKHNTKVGENGSNLSVGQLQRVAIARALYFEPDILILDEPTSALDKNNAEELIETIMRISKKICVIISTHQLNYFPSNSNVFFMENKK